MVTYAGRPVSWKTVVKHSKKNGTIERVQVAVSFVGEDGARHRKTKLFPTGFVPTGDKLGELSDAELKKIERKKANAARKWLKELDDAELAKAEAAKAEAKRIEEEARKAAEEKRRLAEIAADPYANMTVGEYVAQFVEGLVTAGDIERSTAKSYRGAVRHVKEGFPSVMLYDLTSAQVKKWRDDLLRDGYASGSVIKWLRVLSEALRDAVDMEVLDKNPCNAVRAPRRTAPQPNSLTADGYARLARMLDMMEPSPVVVAASIALHCGLRVGEVCGIRWREYDRDARVIHVVEAIGSDGSGKDYTKGPKTVAGRRDVPVPELLARMLDRRRDLMLADLEEAGVTPTAAEFGKLYLCGSAQSGKFASPTIIERQFKGLAESFGIVGSRGRRMTMHGLRDSYATLAIGAGGDVRSVAGVLGHSNPSITLSTYADALPEGKRRVSDLLSSIVTTRAIAEPYAELVE